MKKQEILPGAVVKGPGINLFAMAPIVNYK
jgi:hypothetical protein